MYLASKPIHDSLLSVMGPWPFYILSAAALGLAMFFALDAIAGAARRHDRRDGVSSPRWPKPTAPAQVGT